MRISVASVPFLAAASLLAAAAAARAAGCEGPQVYTAHYDEQICTRGFAGYATCRWVARVHDVTAPPDCAPDLTEERSRPADRGASARTHGVPLGD